MCTVCSRAQVLFLFSLEKFQPARFQLSLFLKALPIAADDFAHWLTIFGEQKSEPRRVQPTFIQLKREVAASPSPTRLGYPNCGIQDAGLYGGVCNGTRIVAGRCLTLQFGFLRGRSSPSLSIWPPSSPAEAHVDRHRRTRASSDRNAGETGRADPDSETASSAGLSARPFDLSTEGACSIGWRRPRKP
jgi:hypothetical protein